MHKWSGARVALVGLGPIGIEVGKALAGRDGHRVPGRGRSGAGHRGPRALGVSRRRRRRRSRSTRPRATSTRAPPARARSGTSSCSARARDSTASSRRSRRRSTPGSTSSRRARSSPIPELAARRARPARSTTRPGRGASRVLGTGVNPGLVMDRLALAAAAACVRVDRVQGHARRGRGQAARAAAREGRSGTLARGVRRRASPRASSATSACRESAAIIAIGLGLPIHEITETIEPVLAAKETDGIAPGRVLGLHQIALVQAGDEVKVALDLTMAVGRRRSGRHDRDRGRSSGAPARLGRLPRRPRDGRMRRQRHSVHRRAPPPGLHTVVTLPLFGLFPDAGRAENLDATTLFAAARG